MSSFWSWGASVSIGCAHTLTLLFFFLMIPRRPSSTLFPYTTLFRSRVRFRRLLAHRELGEGAVGGQLELRRHLRSEEHTSELQSRVDLVCRLLLEKKNNRRWRARQAQLRARLHPPRDRRLPDRTSHP